jgi:hypothetical protein
VVFHHLGYQVSFGKSFAARPGRFWLASASGYRPIRRAGERLGLVSDKLPERPFCRALLPGFAGFGFFVAKQPLPKGGLRLGSVIMPPSRFGSEGSRGEGGGRVVLLRPAALPQRRRVVQDQGVAGGGRRQHRRPRSRISAPSWTGVISTGVSAGEGLGLAASWALAAGAARPGGRRQHR